MNILMALSQRELTGAEVFAVTIANELIARGHKVIIVSDTLTAPTKAEFDAVVALLNECKAQLNDHLSKVKSAGQMA